MSIGTPDTKTQDADLPMLEVTPPVELPIDCQHSWETYDAEAKRIAWRCGLKGDGTPIMVGDGGPRTISDDGNDCVGCPFFEDTRIRYPLTVTDIEMEDFLSLASSLDEPGTPVIARFMEDGKPMTSLGFFLGDFVISPVVSYDKEDGVLSVKGLRNPAMFVPSVGRVVWGCESWWHVTNEEDLRRLFGDDDPQTRLAMAWMDMAGRTKQERGAQDDQGQGQAQDRDHD